MGLLLMRCRAATMTKLLTASAVLIALLLIPVARADEAEAKRTEVDKSVDRALDFLHNQQNADGSWNSLHGGKHPAITSLAIMAFLSAGNVPGEGKHGEVVK